MKSVCIFLASFLAVFLTARGTPQVFFATPLAGRLNSSARQYYAVEYLGNSPQHPSPSGQDYNLNHGDVDAPIDDADDDEDDNENSSYNNGGFVGIVNDEESDSSMMPHDVNPGNEQSIPEDDASAGDDSDDEEDDEEDPQGDIVAEEPLGNKGNGNQSSLGAKLNETMSPQESTTHQESIMTEEDTENPIELGTNNNSNSSSSTTTTEMPDKIMTPFIHPIFRPSSEWALGSSNGNPDIKPSRRPQQGGKPSKKNPNRRRKPQKKRIRIVKRRRSGYRRPIRYGNFRDTNGFEARRSSNSGSRSCGSCQCGVTTTRRIVGGKVAAVNELPWLALITYNNTIQCSGTLINDRFVLTSAHCVRGFDKQLFELRFLEYNTESSMDTVSLRRKISRVYSLKTYAPKTSDDDIAILRLLKPIDFETTTVRPICLPKKGMDLTGETGVIAGWGTPSEEELSSNTLQTTEVPILSNEQCLLVGMTLTNNMVCSGRLLDGEIEACQGDSGGPLMVVKNKRHLLGGVISWGDGCAKPLKPGIYARVTRYLPWIDKHTAGSCKCR